MEYLTKTLGVRVVYGESKNKPSLPNYIYARYEMKEAAIDGIRTVFVCPKEDTDPADAVQKHLERIKDAYGAKPVLVLDRLTSRQKEYLLRRRIPFVVEGKQIYLPFMAAYLQERCDSEKRADRQLLPSAQVLLLYYIYHGCGEMLASDAGHALGFTAMSVSRASRQLEETGLVKTEKKGVGKVLLSDKAPRQLFEEAQPYLPGPIKRTVFVPRKEMKEDLPLAGFSALSDYSMLNPPVAACYATDSIIEWSKSASGVLMDETDQCELEMWRYNPRILSDGRCVDRLSLALSLRNSHDERTEEAVEEMLDKVWRDIAHANGGTPLLKVISVRPLDGYKLWLRFSTGETRVFDCAKLLSMPAFAPLADTNVFKNVDLDHGVPVWDGGEIDIAPETLYANSVPAEDVVDAL